MLLAVWWASRVTDRTASYATGAVAGNDGGDDYVGGLVGLQYNGLITASYAIGSADGGDGDGDTVGGLVGTSLLSSIIDSYGFGTATESGEDGSPEAHGGSEPPMLAHDGQQHLGGAAQS